jgi:hypothetical protein
MGELILFKSENRPMAYTEEDDNDEEEEGDTQEEEF